MSGGTAIPTHGMQPLHGQEPSFLLVFLISSFRQGDLWAGTASFFLYDIMPSNR